MPQIIYQSYHYLTLRTIVMDNIVNYAVLSNTVTLTADKESKKQLSNCYRTTNWQKNTLQAPLSEILARPELITIKTDEVTVIDFDTDESFNRALDFNKHLEGSYQCQLIVKSLRKGGHFYYLPNADIEPPLGHTKQSVLDYLTTDKHNAVAPTSADQGKKILHKGTALTQYNKSIDALIQLLVLENLPSNTRNMVVHADEHRSDDAIDFIKGYLSLIVTQQQFNEFYNIPHEIPPGQSNHHYLKLSTRLGCDETIGQDDYRAVMLKFNDFHQRKTNEELQNEIMRRMLNNSNGLWKYDPLKRENTATFVTAHKRYKTQISSYYNLNTSEYIVHYLDHHGLDQLLTLSNKTQYLDVMEKISQLRSDALRRQTGNIQAVEVIHDYKIKSGYHHSTNTFNTAYPNSNLAAFAGSKPEDYKKPEELIALMEYMWAEETDYMLATTKHRYSTFQFSPVVTFLKGTEGSGKDLSIALLTAGFSQDPQHLNYALLKDKHASWQTGENAVFSEIGSWKTFEKDDLLAELKTISGSNGKVTYRAMQQVARVVPTMIKIWITANEWVKLHTDPVTQRRIHIVYMPRPLEAASGGPYSSADIERICSAENILNFYYWLGNEYRPGAFTLDQYMNAKSRHQSKSYELYIEATQNKADIAAQLLWTQDWNQFAKILDMYELTMEDLDWKISKSNTLVLAAVKLKEVLARRAGAGHGIIDKIIDRMNAEMEDSKRLKINKGIVEKYITIYGQPADLNEMQTIEGEDIELD